MEDDSGEGGDGQRDKANDDTEQAHAGVSLVPVIADANSTSPKVVMAISKVSIAQAPGVRVEGRTRVAIMAAKVIGASGYGTPLDTQ